MHGNNENHRFETRAPFSGFSEFGDTESARDCLIEMGLVEGADVKLLSSDDYESISARAEVLIKQAERDGEELSEKKAIGLAFLDRKANEEAGFRMLEKIDPAVLQQMFSDRFGSKISLGEIKMFFKFLENRKPNSKESIMDTWMEARKSIDESKPLIAVVDNEGSVLGVGEEAERNRLMKEASDRKSNLN